MTQLQNKPKKWLTNNTTNQSSKRQVFVWAGLGLATVGLAASLIFILWPR